MDEFILNFKDKYSIHLDPYLILMISMAKTHLERSIKEANSVSRKPLREKNAIVSNVIRHFRKNIGFMKTKHGTITISVTHMDPQKASNMQITPMEEIKLIETESDTAKKLQLNYLSETLADALQEMENAEKNLKIMRWRTAHWLRKFHSDSLKLDQIRMERRKVIEIAELLSIIENLVKSGNLDNSSYGHSDQATL